LAIGVLDVSEQFSPFSHEVVSSAKQISGRAHLLGVDIGHGDHASPEQCGDFPRVDSVVFAFTTVDGFHVEGMAQDKRDPLVGTQISQPVPDEHTLHGDTDILAVGLDDIQEPFGRGFQVPMNMGFGGLVHISDIHGSGVQIDSAVILVLFGVKSHGASSFG
jgi:hypothetical protein